ncbi:hypothetical protein PU25_15915, partial [Escherichia coli]
MQHTHDAVEVNISKTGFRVNRIKTEIVYSDINNRRKSPAVIRAATPPTNPFFKVLLRFRPDESPN